MKKFVFDNAEKAYDKFVSLPNRKFDIKPFKGILNKYVEYVITKESNIWYLRIK